MAATSMSQSSTVAPSPSNTARCASKLARMPASISSDPRSQDQPILRPSRSPRSGGRPGAKGAATATGARGSGPASTERKSAASATLRAIGPGVFMLCQGMGLGTSGTIQELGRWPTTLHQAAGLRSEPPISEPSASEHSPAASAAPLPPLLAPGARPSPWGLRVAPNSALAHSGLAMVSSGVLSLPSTMAPAAFSRSTTRWSASGTWFSKAFEAKVVRRPAVAKQSLTPTVRPWSGPRRRPRRRSSSRRRAWSSARSRHRVTKALRRGLWRSMRAIWAATSSAERSSPASSSAFCSTAGR